MSTPGEDPQADAAFLRDVRRAGVDLVLAGVEKGAERELELYRDIAQTNFYRLGQLETRATALLEELGRFEELLVLNARLQGISRGELDNLAAALERECRDARHALHLVEDGARRVPELDPCFCSICSQTRKPVVVRDERPRRRRTR